MSDWISTDWFSPVAAALLIIGVLCLSRHSRRGSGGGVTPPPPAVVFHPAPPPAAPLGRTRAEMPPAARSGRASSRTGLGSPGTTGTLTAGVRDGLTGATIDQTRPLWRCAACETCYHDESRRTLLEEAAGGCLSCHGTDLRRFTPAPARPARPATPAAALAAGPVTLTARVCWLEASAEPGFIVALLENKPWRQALKLVFPPTFTARPGAMAFLAALRDRDVTVSGILATDGPLGPRIVVTNRRSLAVAAAAVGTPEHPPFRHRS